MPQIIDIHSLDDSRLDWFTHLTEPQLRNRLEPEKGIFIAESPKVIRVALAHGHKPLAWLMDRHQLAGQGGELLQEAPANDAIPLFTGDTEVLAHLTGFELTRGILCAMRRPTLPTPEEVCRNARRIAVLDNVVNATNTGAIFRAATALGIDGILLSPTCCDAFNRRSVRVSMGTLFQIPWTYLGATAADWPAKGLQTLHDMGFETVAMALSPNAISIDSPVLTKIDRMAIVLGTEGDGLTHEAIEGCTHTVKIPMSHGVDSLNVAGAAALAFWELRVR